MITEYGAKRAMRELREAGFIVEEKKLPTMARRWIDALNKHGRANIDDDELEEAARRYIAQDHPLHHWPSAGQLEACAIEIRNRTDSRYYVEPEPDGPRATPEEARLAWKAAGYDPDAVKEELGRTRGPQMPRSWAESAKEAIDQTMVPGGRVPA